VGPRRHPETASDIMRLIEQRVRSCGHSSISFATSIAGRAWLRSASTTWPADTAPGKPRVSGHGYLKERGKDRNRSSFGCAANVRNGVFRRTRQSGMRARSNGRERTTGRSGRDPTIPGERRDQRGHFNCVTGRRGAKRDALASGKDARSWRRALFLILRSSSSTIHADK
jgi:hypothetical protein